MPEKKLFAPTSYHVYAPDDLSQRWYVEYYDGTKRCRPSKGINKWKTRKRRMRAAEELIGKLKEQHRYLRQSSTTESGLRRYLEQGRGGWKKSTYEDYEGILRAFWSWLNGREVTEKLLREYLGAHKQRLHPTTWNKYRDTIRRGLSDAGFPNWFDEIPLLKTSKTPARYFQSYQADRIARVVQEERPDLWLFIQFMYYTLMRPKEIRKLRIGDILLDEGEIWVSAEISKNKKTEYVAIPDRLRPVLEFARYQSPGELLFPGEDGKELGKNMMYRAHKKILDKLNFGKGYTLYSWKHTGAVALAKAGVSIKEIQIQMRHHSLDQTDEYLRGMGVRDVETLRRGFPPILLERKDRLPTLQVA